MKVDKWYDRKTRSWIIQTLDAEGNQIGDATYVGSRGEADREKVDRKRELQKMKARDVNEILKKTMGQ